MAFSREQVKRARTALIVAVLALVAIVAAVAALSAPGRPAADGAQPAGSSEPAAPAASSMEDVDAGYGPAVAHLQAAYDADRSDEDALLALANGYFDWGAAAMAARAADGDDAHVAHLFQHAVAFYTEYLEACPDAPFAVVDRAIAIFYQGDGERAIAELEAFTAKEASFAPAWANLGMFYEGADRAGDARVAYERAIEADAQDTYHVRTYAQQRLDALDAD